MAMTAVLARRQGTTTITRLHGSGWDMLPMSHVTTSLHRGLLIRIRIDTIAPAKEPIADPAKRSVVIGTRPRTRAIAYARKAAPKAPMNAAAVDGARPNTRVWKPRTIAATAPSAAPLETPT